MIGFGIYLVHEGLIDAGQLVDALEAQQASLPPIGQIALEQGKLTVREVFRLVRVQSDLPHDRLGELAIAMGLLTRKELAELLLVQAEQAPSLWKVLVWQGVLSENEAEVALAKYRKQMEYRANPAAKAIRREDISLVPPKQLVPLG